MRLLNNPYTSVAIAVTISQFLSPKIVNAFVLPEMASDSGLRNDMALAGINGFVTASVFVVMQMAFGVKAST